MVTPAMIYGLGLGVKGAFELAQRIRAKSADEILSEDGRPPILYLPRFSSDARSLLAGIDTGIAQSEETYLMKALNTHGPTIALDRPGSWTPPPKGAARLKLGDNWMSVVEDLILTVLGVVMQCDGSGPAISWEVNLMLTKLRPEQVLLSIPGQKKKYDEWLTNYGSMFPVKLPTHPQLDRTVNAYDGLIRFDNNWIPEATWEGNWSTFDFDFVNSWAQTAADSAH